MSRRINTEQLFLGVSPTGSSTADDYLGRVVKYIPAEIVGLYLAAGGMVPKDNNGHLRCHALWVIFWASYALVPIYFYFATTQGGQKPLWPQIILASIAFPVWTFAIGGPFTCFSSYESWIASVLLIFVTVAMGFYRPAAGS